MLLSNAIKVLSKYGEVRQDGHGHYAKVSTIVNNHEVSFQSWDSASDDKKYAGVFAVRDLADGSNRPNVVRLTTHRVQNLTRAIAFALERTRQEQLSPEYYDKIYVSMFFLRGRGLKKQLMLSVGHSGGRSEDPALIAMAEEWADKKAPTGVLLDFLAERTSLEVAAEAVRLQKVLLKQQADNLPCP